MRRRTILVAAGGLVFLLGSGTLLAAGWQPVGPPDLPVTPYEPMRAGWGADRTLANVTLRGEGSTYEVDVIGREGRGALYGFRFRVFHTGGDGLRVWPAAAAIESPSGEGRVDYRERPDGASLSSRGHIEAWVDYHSNRPTPAPETFHANLSLDVYREAWVGLVRGQPVTVRLSFPLQFEVPG